MLVSLAVIPSIAASRDIGIAFIEDDSAQSSPPLSNLIVEELQSLLGQAHRVKPTTFSSDDPNQDLSKLLALANNRSDIEHIVASGVIGSQQFYNLRRFDKPTWLLRILDSTLTGIPERSNVPNLHVFTENNSITAVFNRIKNLFNASRVAVILPRDLRSGERTISTAITRAAAQFGMQVKLLPLNFATDLAKQLIDIDAVVLPPVAVTEQQQRALLQFLRRQKIPSFAVGGESAVLNGALISDTLAQDNRVLARRIALEMQLVISGESRTSGVTRLEPQQRTTINIDTARAIEIDLDFDEVLTARIVQDSDGISLGLLSALELAADRNLRLTSQREQIKVDRETLRQAVADKLPQLFAQTAYTRRGEQLPEHDTLATIALTQELYSPSSNASVDSAELSLAASQSTLDQVRLDTVAQTASAYFTALQSQAQLESSLRELALNRDNLALAEQRVSSGSGAGAEVYRWQSITAASENAVLKAYAANTSVQRQLAQLLNSRLQVPASLEDVSLDQPPFDLLHEALEPYLLSTGKATRLEKVVAQRSNLQSPQLKVDEANVKIIDRNVKALRQSYFTPELSLTAQYSQYLEGSENAAGMELEGQDDWSVSINAELPLWLGGQRSSQIRQLVAQNVQANAQRQATQLALWSDAGDAVINLITNYRAIGLNRKSENAALRSLRITQNAYQLGAATISELLDTQTEYSDAQNNARVAQYQYLNALVDFQALLGEFPMLEPGENQNKWLAEFLPEQSTAALKTETAQLQQALDALSDEIHTKVVFGSSGATLGTTAKQTLDKVAGALNRYRQSFVQITGHTDSTGGEVENRMLSTSRANAVLDYLVLRGVDAARLRAVGLGESQPIASNRTANGRKQNRRVEFTVIESFTK